jgi:hypothetical protein
MGMIGEATRLIGVQRADEALRAMA